MVCLDQTTDAENDHLGVFITATRIVHFHTLQIFQLPK